MLTNTLQSFIIGSSSPVFVPFLRRVAKIPEERRNYSYEDYSIIAPLYFGTTAALASVARNKFDLSLAQSLLIITIISIIFVLSFVNAVNAYNFSEEEWNNYVMRIIIYHSIAYATIYAISRYIFDIE